MGCMTPRQSRLRKSWSVRVSDGWQARASRQATHSDTCACCLRRTLTKLRAKHAETPNSTFGINGNTGDIVDMQQLGVWEPYAVKVRHERGNAAFLSGVKGSQQLGMWEAYAVKVRSKNQNQNPMKWPSAWATCQARLHIWEAGGQQTCWGCLKC